MEYRIFEKRPQSFIGTFADGRLHMVRLVRGRLLCKIRSWHDPQCAFKRLWRFLEQKKRLAASAHEEFRGAAFGSSQHRIKRARSLRP